MYYLIHTFLIITTTSKQRNAHKTHKHTHTHTHTQQQPPQNPPKTPNPPKNNKKQQQQTNKQNKQNNYIFINNRTTTAEVLCQSIITRSSSAFMQHLSKYKFPNQNRILLCTTNGWEMFNLSPYDAPFKNELIHLERMSTRTSQSHPAVCKHVTSHCSISERGTHFPPMGVTWSCNDQRDVCDISTQSRLVFQWQSKTGFGFMRKLIYISQPIEIRVRVMTGVIILRLV